MAYNNINNKVLTENSLLDEIVWNAQIMIRDTVLKDQVEADLYEDLETMTQGDILLGIKDKTVRFDIFVYTRDILSQIPSLSTSQVEYYEKHNDLIPQDIRPQLLQLASEKFLNNYTEKNNYYRYLHGLPDYDITGDWKGLYVDKNTISERGLMPDVTRYPLIGPQYDYVLIHELDISTIELLYETDIIDKIINDTNLLDSLRLTKKDVRYLRRMGPRSIDIYDARKAAKFELLYCPSADAIEVENRYRELIEANRRITLYTIYSEAYKFQSDYYDRFMIIMIIIQTMIDMVIELPEYIIRRDIFDVRTCKYIFESNGVEYFPDIPLKYQVALVKNLNKIIKFKSTDKCLIDICSIFGCKNINIFKYHILKSRRNFNDDTEDYMNQTVFDKKTNTEKEDELANYDLKFVKVPIFKNFDNYIRSNKNILSYDTVTSGDAYWTGDRDTAEVMNMIKEQDFTLLRSKYYSIEALLDLTERTFQLVYFTNILMYNKIDKSKLKVTLPNISTKKEFELTDVIALLYTLAYLYYGAEDTIMDTQSKVLSVLGFNFEADLTKIGEYIYNNYQGKTLEELGVHGFKIPPMDKILTYKQLMEIYTTNKNIYDHVKNMLINPPNKEMYDIYRYIYKSLFIMKLNMEQYKLPNGNIAHTYSEFFSHKDSLIYTFIEEIKSINDSGKRQTACVNAIQSITNYLRDYLDEDKINFIYIFGNLPSISLDFIKHYIEEIINFFKSFKIFTHDMSMTYRFTDKYDNYIQIIDWMLLKYIFHKSEVVKIEDWIANNKVGITKDTYTDIMDKVWLYINRTLSKNYSEFMDNYKYTRLTKSIKVVQEYFSKFYSDEFMNKQILDEMFILYTTLLCTDNSIPHDDIYKILYYLHKDEYIKDYIKDSIFTNVIHSKVSDRFDISYDIMKKDKYSLATKAILGREIIFKSNINMQISTYYDADIIYDNIQIIPTYE